MLLGRAEEDVRYLGVFVEVESGAQGFALAATAGQAVRGCAVTTTIAGEDEQVLIAMSLVAAVELVAAFVVDAVEVDVVAFDAAYPAALAEDDGDGLDW